MNKLDEKILEQKNKANAAYTDDISKKVDTISLISGFIFALCMLGAGILFFLKMFNLV